MYATVTAASLITQAGTFANEIAPIVLLVGGAGVAFGFGRWILSRVRKAAQ